MKREDAERFARYHMEMNRHIREMTYVFSMSEAFDVDSMWAYYAGGNNGFCIQYDYSKADNMSVEIKRSLLNTYPIYYGEKPQYSFLSMMQPVFSGQQDMAMLQRANQEFMAQMFTKKKEWNYEREWRIMLNSLLDSKFYVDLVSGIIIDERALQTEPAQRLIDLAKQRGWTIKVRRINAIGTNHIYEELK